MAIAPRFCTAILYLAPKTRYRTSQYLFADIETNAVRCSLNVLQPLIYTRSTPSKSPHHSAVYPAQCLFEGYCQSFNRLSSVFAEVGASQARRRVVFLFLSQIDKQEHQYRRQVREHVQYLGIHHQ